MPGDKKPLTKTGNPATTIEERAGHENYQLSCLMRIADATEAMAANYNQMRTDKELYEKWQIF